MLANPSEYLYTVITNVSQVVRKMGSKENQTLS